MQARLCVSLLCLGLLCSCSQSVPDTAPVDYVDPFIGTSNSRWMLGPYATLPFGMVQLGPDNQGDQWMGGYEYAINSISGFSHIHAWTMGGLLIMPSTIDLVTGERPVDAPYKGAQAGYHSRIEKATEKASPGYYEVYLYDQEVLAQMTVGKRSGFMQFTFPEREEARILVDLDIPSEYRYQLEEGHFKQVSENEVVGFAQSQVSRWNDYTLYFVLRFDTPIERMDGFHNNQVEEDLNTYTQTGDAGALLHFTTDQGQVIRMQSGISLVSIEQARLNLDTEMNPFDWDFEAACQNANDFWNNLLGRIQVESDSDTDLKRFYTNLYRAYCAKQTWSDVNGQYRDPGETIRQVKNGHEMYGGDAFWNSFWNLNPLWTLISPEYANNYIETQLELFKHTGWTSKGPTGLEYSGIMVGNHEMALMASAYQKGLRTDGHALYEAMLKNVTVNRDGNPYNGHPGNSQLDLYRAYGYIPYDLGKTSNVLDYAYDDWIVAQMAKAVGDDDNYDLLMKRSKSYLNIFHPEKKFFVPKNSDGEWMEGFSEFSNYSFIEGNSWQYLWYLPHAIPDLMDLLGPDLFNQRLEHGFEQSAQWKFAAHFFDRTTGGTAEYYINHGNQVNMQAAWLFNFSGKPWLTQKYTHGILENYYGSTPYHGWEGDEDEGQMGAWFVISSMGLFEMDGACAENPKMQLSSPLFDRITINLDQGYYPGGEFIIEAKNLNKENIYIQSATLNGEALNRSWVYFKEITAGGKLVYTLGPEPNEGWGE